MTSYKCCLLDESEMVIAVDVIDSEGSVPAMVQAATLIVRKYANCSAIEVWDSAHRIGRIDNPRLGTGKSRYFRSRPTKHGAT